MDLASLGWQSWSPPAPKWHGLPLWDYPPYANQMDIKSTLPHPRHHRIIYWCSWYAVGKNISHQNIIEQAQLIKKHQLPIDYILIDDGWCRWGDWDSPITNRFPNLTATVQQLHSLGFKVGLWYAPYLVDPQSDFAHHNKAYLGKIHLPFPSKRELKLTETKVVDQLHHRIAQSVKRYSLDLVKLDFLYAPYFQGLIPAQSHTVIDSLFTMLHSLDKKLITIACGAPFSDVVAKATSTRLSKDTTFPPPYPLWVRRYVYVQRMRLLVSKYTIWQKSRSFACDPDVRLFTLDTPSTAQYWDQIKTNTKGIGDDISRLSPQQIAEMKKWLKT